MPSSKKEFLLRYVGARFAGARLPLDVVLDLPAFRELLVAYAKQEWRERHADRQRLPKGFDSSINFDLVAIEEGSAMPKLEWRREQAQEYLPDFTDEIEEVVEVAYNKVLTLIDGSGHDQFPRALSSDKVRALNRLGASLLESERIEFPNSRGADGNVIYLDLVRRKALITRVRETYHSRFEDIGVLKGNNIDGFIDVSTDKYGDLRIAVDSSRIEEEFDGNIGSNVQFDLQIELDNTDAFRSVIEVNDVDLIHQDIVGAVSRCLARMSELKNLPVGWHDGDGKEISDKAIDAARNFLVKRPQYAKLYYIYPTLSGGLLFEFEKAGWDYSVEILEDGRIDFYGVEIEGDSEIDFEQYASIDELLAQQFDNLVGRED